MKDHKTEFIKVVVNLLKDEGGYVNHTEDPGGETKFGISKRSYPHLDIKNLTEEEAANIYYTDWWCRHAIGEVPNQYIREKLFNISVNIGYRGTIKCFQRAIRCVSDNKIVLQDDGVYGSKTKKSLEGFTADQRRCLYYAFKSEIAHYYRSLNKDIFIKGWLNRAYK